MTERKSRHITEHEFADLLIGATVGPQVQEHVATCDACREELNVFAGTIGDFGSVSLRWIESRPGASLHQAARDRARHTRRPWYGWAISAAVALLIAIPVWTHARRDPGATQNQGAAVQQTGLDNSESQIARDNELLKSVDLALSDADSSPLRQFGMDSERREGIMQTESRNE